MPALITESDFMFSANRVVPWHGLGEVIEDAPDSIAAIKIAKLDWEVNQKQIFVDGEAVPNYIANVRSDNKKVLGIVTDRYQIVQNLEAFNFTDALIGDGEVRYETAGSLKEGRIVWMLAKMNQEFSILGDKFDPYLCFTQAHDGTGAVRAMMTPVRVVCKNTLNMAIRQASRAWSTTHVGDVTTKLSEAQRTLGLANKYMAKLDEEANLLSEIYVPDNKIIEILNELLPIDSRVTDRQANTVLRKREGIQRALKADDITKFANTGWAVINAVSDFVGHAEPARNTSSYRENQFGRIISGETLFDRTYELLKQVA